MSIDFTTLLSWLLEQLATLQLMLARAAVQRQLLAFAIVLVVAWLIPRLIGRLLGHLEPDTPAGLQTTSGWQARIVRWLRAFDYALFPILALVGYQVVIDQFRQRGWPTGLIESVLPIFWLFLGYRLLASLVLAFVPRASSERYLGHFLRPLLLIVVVFLIRRILFDVLAVSDMLVFRAQGIAITLGGLLSAANTLLVFYVASWVVYELLVHLFQRSQAEPGVSDTVSNVSRWAIMGLGLLVALGVLGADVTTLAWIGTGLSVGIGFGVQELFGNFVSGILLAFERSVRPGDIIETGGQRGTVSKIGMRATLLRTADNVEVFVPNKELLTKPVLAYTYSDRTSKVRLTVGVDYASDLEEVGRLLQATLRSHPLVLETPPPEAALRELGDYSIIYQLTGSIADYVDGARVKADLARMVRDTLHQHGIAIPYPRHDLRFVE